MAALLAPLCAALDRPGWRFPAIVCAIAALVFLIPLFGAHFDITKFIVAGDRYVNAAQVPVPIMVRENSDGYDGQFYFRLAIAPNAHAFTEAGVTWDNSSWRMQRIGYPALVYLASGGRAVLVPLMLVLVNFCGLAAIAFYAQKLRLQLDLSVWFPVAVAAWPGYFITLTHDTTEIVELAFILAAISVFASARYWLYALLAAAATLTRETSVFIFGGIFAVSALQCIAERVQSGILPTVGVRRTVYCLLALLPFLAWRHYMEVLWGVSPTGPGSTLLGWPLVGIYEKLALSLAGTQRLASNPFVSGLRHALTFLTLGGLMALGALVAARLSKAVRADATLGGLALGWVLLAVLLACLTSSNGGPWVDMTSYLRSCTDFWALSLLMLARSRFTLPRSVGAAGWGLWAATVAVNL
jgi:hypothetical protein